MSSYKARIGIALASVIGMVVIGCASSGNAKKSEEAQCPYAKAAARPLSETVVRGGQLYDKYWAVTKTKAPDVDHPLWATRPDKTSNKSGGSATWRCKECHGWDYVGEWGAYKEGSHRTGFPGVAGTKRTVDEIVTLLAADPGMVRGGHGYTAATGMTTDDLRAVAEFCKEGVMNTTYLVDHDGKFAGEAERGRHTFENGVGKAKACKKCHGDDGLKPPDDDNPTFDDYIGKIANENALELLHKMRFGQPGTKMPALAGQGISPQELADLGAYAQTLPQEP